MPAINDSIPVSLDRPTLWKMSIRDVFMLLAAMTMAGATYAGMRYEIAQVRGDVAERRGEVQALTDKIGRLNDTINNLAVQVAKLEGRLER